VRNQFSGPWDGLLIARECPEGHLNAGRFYARLKVPLRTGHTFSEFVTLHAQGEPPREASVNTDRFLGIWSIRGLSVDGCAAHRRRTRPPPSRDVPPTA
jgi:hypothetical protein